MYVCYFQGALSSTSCESFPSNHSFLRGRDGSPPLKKPERILTPTLVGGLKLSLKCAVRWGLRICGRQFHRTTTPASNLSEYYKRTISVPVLDHLADPDRRFSSHQKTVFQGLYLVPSVLVTIDLETVSSVWMKVGEL